MMPGSHQVIPLDLTRASQKDLNTMDGTDPDFYIMCGVIQLYVVPSIPDIIRDGNIL